MAHVENPVPSLEPENGHPMLPKGIPKMEMIWVLVCEIPLFPFPIGSMYGLFTYTLSEKWPHSLVNVVNVGKYSRPMDPLGSSFCYFSVYRNTMAGVAMGVFVKGWHSVPATHQWSHGCPWCPFDRFAQMENAMVTECCDGKHGCRAEKGRSVRVIATGVCSPIYYISIVGAEDFGVVVFSQALG